MTLVDISLVYFTISKQPGGQSASKQINSSPKILGFPRPEDLPTLSDSGPGHRRQKLRNALLSGSGTSGIDCSTKKRGKWDISGNNGIEGVVVLNLECTSNNIINNRCTLSGQFSQSSITNNWSTNISSTHNSNSTHNSSNSTNNSSSSHNSPHNSTNNSSNSHNSPHSSTNNSSSSHNSPHNSTNNSSSSHNSTNNSSSSHNSTNNSSSSHNSPHNSTNNSSSSRRLTCNKNWPHHRAALAQPWLLLWSGELGVGGVAGWRGDGGGSDGGVRANVDLGWLRQTASKEVEGTEVSAAV
ncbi:hypothetical protein FHG87_015734 [Trinorchestia longiramus]|nr:hypothetical protein FHG87_015734 [Trinorchestia longiramus]